MTVLLPSTPHALATICRTEGPHLQGTLCLLNPKKGGRWILELCPPQRYIHVLTPRTCEHDLNWKQSLCRYN